MPTLKQTRLLKAIETNTELKSAGIEAGYEMDKGGRTIYRKGTRKLIEAHIGTDPKLIIARYEDLIGRCRENKDRSTERACLDSLARINAMFTDKVKQEVTTDIQPTVPTEELKIEARKVLERLDNAL